MGRTRSKRDELGPNTGIRSDELISILDEDLDHVAVLLWYHHARIKLKLEVRRTGAIDCTFLLYPGIGESLLLHPTKIIT